MKIKRIALSIFSIALIGFNIALMLPKNANAQELAGARADCYWTWRPNGPGVLTSFIQCDDCTRIEAWVPSDERRCRIATVE